MSSLLYVCTISYNMPGSPCCRFSELKLLSEVGSTFDNVTFSFQECEVFQILLPSRGTSKVERLMNPASFPM